MAMLMLPLQLRRESEAKAEVMHTEAIIRLEKTLLLKCMQAFAYQRHCQLAFRYIMGLNLLRTALEAFCEWRLQTERELCAKTLFCRMTVHWMQSILQTWRYGEYPSIIDILLMRLPSSDHLAYILLSWFFFCSCLGQRMALQCLQVLAT